MSEKREYERIRAPLSDADRLTISLAMSCAVRDEVLDVVVERLARDLQLDHSPDRASRAPSATLRLCRDGPGDDGPSDHDHDLAVHDYVEPKLDPWVGFSSPPVVTVIENDGPVLAKIG